MRIFTYQDAGCVVHPELSTVLPRLLIDHGIDISVRFGAVPPEVLESFEKEPTFIDLISLSDKLYLHMAEGERLDEGFPKLLGVTRNQSGLADSCRENLKGADWGINFGNACCTYAPEENQLATQIHELFHFFNVNDCYQENDGQSIETKPTCDNEHCLMRYTPKDIEICRAVVEQLKAYERSLVREAPLRREGKDATGNAR